MFARWAWNTLFIATVSTAISLFCGLLAGYALARLQFRWAAPLGTLIFVTYLVPPTLLFIPLGDVVKTVGLGDTPWFQDDSARDRGVRPDRRGEPDPGHGADQLSARGPGHPVGGDLRVHAVLERVPLRPRLPVAIVYSFFVEHYVTALTGAVKG
jgi:hypothetical protein